MPQDLTDMEKQVLTAFPEDTFYENGLESILWTDCFLDTVEEITGIDSRQSRGIISSLKQKGFMEIDGGHEDSTINLTEKGKQFLNGKA